MKGKLDDNRIKRGHLKSKVNDKKYKLTHFKGKISFRIRLFYNVGSFCWFRNGNKNMDILGATTQNVLDGLIHAILGCLSYIKNSVNKRPFYGVKHAVM